MDYQETLSIILSLKGEEPNRISEVETELMNCQTGETKTVEYSLKDDGDAYYHLKYNLCRYINYK